MFVAACVTCLSAFGVGRKSVMVGRKAAPSASAIADRTLRAKRVTTNQRTIRKDRRRAFAAGDLRAFTHKH